MELDAKAGRLPAPAVLDEASGAIRIIPHGREVEPGRSEKDPRQLGVGVVSECERLLDVGLGQRMRDGEPALFGVSERGEEHENGDENTVSSHSDLRPRILGVETECRIGKAVYPWHYDQGYHITGTAGVFGAAAASGKILGLDARQMTWALGIAATQSAGLREMFGTMCKSFHPGRASQNGLTAALLASKNFTSSDQSLEATRGFANTMSAEHDFTHVTKGLGETFEVERNTCKPFACGIVIHPIIDGCVQLRNEHGLGPSDITRVELRVNPLVLELTGKKTPSTGLEGKFSVFHSAAVAFVRGSAGQKEYTDDAVRDRTIVAVRDRVSAAVDPAVREEEAYVSVTLKDGRTSTSSTPSEAWSVR